jgi:radical SAM superfamily enzyme YgiQ (UPF0313 family)
MATRPKKKPEPYRGFEQGPIRPPGEAHSLLVRVTRNCPWNRCRFCPVYKRARFSLRPVDHVIEDIEQVHRYVSTIRETAGEHGRLTPADVNHIGAAVRPGDQAAFQAALNWFAGGMQSVFLQDANSLVIKPQDLKTILTHLRRCFPWVTRVTSYARSRTIARMAQPDLQSLAGAGLNRIHIGLESGADAVLQRMRKGTTKAGHIKAGQKVKAAGMELSEYVMPGLGGRELSRLHALETADALNRIDPDFIRLRTLAIPNHTDLAVDRDQGRFEKLGDRETAEEMLLFLEHLNGITSMVKSDHILNLFQEVEGRLPDDQAAMTGAIRAFLALAPEAQVVFQTGRRLGLLACLADMEVPERRRRAEQAVATYGIRPDNVDTVVEEIMKRFI